MSPLDICTSWRLLLLIATCHCAKHEIADPATLFDILPRYTQKIITKNSEEVASWQPYGNVDTGLLDPQSAALQRKWNEWNQHITMNGNIDSARLLVSFGLMPILSASGNELHKAVTLNDKERVIQILSDPQYVGKMDIDSEKSDGSTPIILASIMGHTDIVAILCKEGAYLEQSSSSGATALHFAAMLGHSDIVSTLLQHGADCDHRHPFALSTALHFAVEMDHHKIVRLLCESHQCNAEAEKSHGGRAIHIATESNAAKSLKVLLQKCNVDIESQLLNDTTALYLAALNGFTSIARILLDEGAQSDAVMPVVARRDMNTYKEDMYGYGSPNKPNPEYNNLYYPDKNLEIGNGATPLHAAVENGHIDVVKLLLERGARQLGTMEGSNPIYTGVQYNQYAITKLLLNADSSHSNIDHKLPRNGHSSLYLAVHQRSARFVKLLLKYGADPNIQNRYGVTPLYMACVMRQAGLVKVVLKYIQSSSDIVLATSTGDGLNALHAAVYYNCYKCLDLLVEYDPLLLLSSTKDKRNVLHLLMLKNKVRMATVEHILDVAHAQGFLKDIVNQKTSEYQYTPLVVAAQQNHTDVIELLIEKGADCYAGLSKDSPLWVAAYKGYANVVKLLLNKCEDVDLTQEQDQYTPIHVACMKGYVEVVKEFVKYGISISVMDKRAQTVKDNNEPQIRELGIHEIEPFCVDMYHKTQQSQKKMNTEKQEL
eukprot:506958_1